MSWKRIALVTGGLAVAGAIAGAVVGAAFMAGMTIWLFGGLSGLGDGMYGGMYYVALGAGFCAALGFVLVPLSAWLLMRHVPLWLAIGGTALGTFAGMVYGLWNVGIMVAGSSIVVLGPDNVFGIALYPLLGFGASALALRLLVRPKRSTLAAGETPPRLAGGDPG